MRKSTYLLLSSAALFLALTTISSCDKDKTEIEVVVPEDCPDTISFSGIVEPMIQANCSTSGCHDAGSASSGYNLEGHGNISANANDILNVINHEPGVVAMPYFQPKLSDSIIEQFDCWIAQGTLNN